MQNSKTFKKKKALAFSQKRNHGLYPTIFFLNGSFPISHAMMKYKHSLRNDDYCFPPVSYSRPCSFYLWRHGSNAL